MKTIKHYFFINIDKSTSDVLCLTFKKGDSSQDYLLNKSIIKNKILLNGVNESEFFYDLSCSNSRLLKIVFLRLGETKSISLNLLALKSMLEKED